MKTPALLLAALLLAGCTGPAVVAQVPATSTSAAPAPAATEADVDSTEAVTVEKDDFLIELKVTEKQCFGSAGCNVTRRSSSKLIAVVTSVETY